MKKKIIALSALALAQSVGTVALIQNSIVQTYAEEKNKDVTSQEFLDYIKALAEVSEYEMAHKTRKKLLAMYMKEANLTLIKI